MLLDKYLGSRLCGKQKFYAILIVAVVLLITSALRYYNFPHFARGVTKLMYLQARYSDSHQVRNFMSRSIRGEITI